ncbi:MAG: lactate utilization protein [Ruminococcaceae bacterium]|nr:lactate utilization protein [Oscillospiraceae bacterium]
MENLKKARENQAKTIIKNLEKRNMTAFYCESKEDCRNKILEIIGNGKSISWGGTMSMKQCGVVEELEKNPSLTILDRAKQPADKMKDFYKEVSVCDYFIMGTNAITLDGELVNIDGYGNRVASLIFGPEHVIVIAGMNKVSTDIPEALHRVRNIASPPNTVRLSKNTPCAVDGRCHDCYSPDCICNQVVITRRSRDKDRIIVILVNENLGF